MGKRLIVLVFLFLFGLSEATIAERLADTAVSAEDDKIIAILEILELLEIVDDMALFKDIEYLMEAVPNESQK